MVRKEVRDLLPGGCFKGRVCGGDFCFEVLKFGSFRFGGVEFWRF